ncbi:MAG: ABC transporter substrate-binding protein [Oligoflexia bacterium]|nr:ABC transporter substrate-binding protein [Oligoflexia bacterium]
MATIPRNLLLSSILNSILCIIFLIPSHGAHGQHPKFKRIVSLAPNLTEIILALGLEQELVGVTNFCNVPTKKTIIGGLTNPSLEAIISLRPDLVVMTTDGNPQDVAKKLERLKIKIYVFKAKHLRELLPEILSMGQFLGAENQTKTLTNNIKQQLDNITPSPPDRRRRPKTLFLIWPTPIIIAGKGTFIDDALDMLKLDNLSRTVNYPQYSLEEIIRQSPEIIFIGQSHSQTQANTRKIYQELLSKLRSVPAVKNHKVFFVSDTLYRLGPKIATGIEELQRCLKNSTCQ